MIDTGYQLIAAPVEQRMLEEARRAHWTMERLEKEYILTILGETGGHRGHAAEILGIDRRTLYRKLKQYSAEGDARADHAHDDPARARHR